MTVTQMRVGDLLELARTPIEVKPGHDYSAIGIKSFGKGIFHYPPCDADALSKLRYFKYPAGALALSNIKAWEGAIAVSGDEDLHTVASNRFLFYVPRGDGVDVRYLYYYFLSERGLAQIGQASPGSADRNRTLSMSSFENLLLPLPELAEQRRIAAKLDATTSRLASIESLRTQMIDLQSDLRESLVHSTQKAATTRVRMGNVVRLTREPVNVDPEALYRAIGMRSFGKGIIRYQATVGGDLSKLNYFTFPAEALALSNIKAWEGAISVTSSGDLGHVASNRFLFYLPIDDRVNVSYLRHYLLSRQGLAQIAACSPGAADRNRTLGVKRFEGIEFDLPERSAQDKVARTLDALAAKLSSAYSPPTLTALRPALLNAAFTGEL